MTRTAQGEKIVQAAVQLGLATVRARAFISEDNLGLQRKRFRYASFAKAMPNRVPTPPVDYEETDTLLTDTEVIDRMSFHMRIGSAPAAAGCVLRHLRDHRVRRDKRPRNPLAPPGPTRQSPSAPPSRPL